ncbi:BCCT family transporter [Haematospirillum jordaniae]|uniref:BCCT family transporter n=1 Tax=Haematospirillum jordaniae TaxID=1549855 RepID=UPI001432B152|nr:BCCT family transporter [Haematospirillum jordaniae]NKD86194.1 BCCT family transporter [Haematospirillum jordaniae]
MRHEKIDLTDRDDQITETVESIPEPEGETEIIETDYTVGQDNIARQWTLEFDFHHIVFTVSALSVVFFTFITLALQNDIEPVFVAIRDAMTSRLGPFFLFSGNILVVLCLVLVVSPLGKVRLGGPDATPDYGYIGWFAMLFAAGMGVGLIFFGVAEPMTHFSASLAGVGLGDGGARIDTAPLGAASGDEALARSLAMAATIFHWGLHPWSIYAVAALALALFSYNKGLPLTLRSIFYPLIGERVWGWPGHLVDILAIFSTVSGLAVTLGVGAQQIAAGLDFLMGVGTSNVMLVLLVIAITMISVWSIVKGLDGGIRRASEYSMLLAVIFMLFIIVAGPTADLMSGFVQNVLGYGQYILPLSIPFGREDTGFVASWTAPYWAWWISWSPFVGMFIARISRGRTVREFLVAVLLIPTLLSVLWMTALGDTAIAQVVHNDFTGAQDAVLEIKLFEMLGQLPLSGLASAVGVVLIILFFITSSDSGSLVVDTIAAGGKVNAPIVQRVFWALFGGLVAIALSLGGGLAALQAMVLCTGLPFAFVLMVACYSIVLGLVNERRVGASQGD